MRQSGASLAGAAVGGAAGAAGVHRSAHAAAVRRQERHDYAGNGRGVERVWWSVETTEKVAALTFDDGPHPELTPLVLAMLAQRGLAATFFMVGHNAADHRPHAAAVVAAGHEVGNHTWSHCRLVEEDPVTVAEDVARGASALRRITGVAPRWFRPPRGMVTGEVLIAAASAGEEVVLWSVTRGGSSVHDAAGVGAHLRSHLHPGAIIDLHDGTGRRHDARLMQRRQAELAALPGFLDWAIADGYQFLTLSDLVARAPAGERA